MHALGALPVMVTFSSVSAPTGVTGPKPAVGMTGTVVCTRITMASSSALTIMIVTKVTARASGSITNSAVVSTAKADPVSVNNTATVTNSVYGKR